MDYHKNNRKPWMWNLFLNFAVLMASHNNLIKMTTSANTLTGIDPRNYRLTAMNLSSANLTGVHQRAFAKVSDLRTLNLAYNSLRNLPNLVFQNLTSLHSLDLSNNELISGNFYEGLGGLGVLDISHNPLRYFGPGHFFGLPKFTNILTRGIRISKLSGTMFEHPTTHEGANRVLVKIADSDPRVDVQSIFISSKEDSGPAIKICIDKSHLKFVEDLTAGEILPKECIKSQIIDGILNLNKLGIKTFGNQWFRVLGYKVSSIYLERNNIDEMTSSVLNDLPRGIKRVSLRENVIERLQSGIMENDNSIEILDLSGNFLNEIETRAFRKLNLTNKLLLDYNLLNNTKFMDSLPLSIQLVSLVDNIINEISDGDFTRFQDFYCLNLTRNKITELKRGKLTGFSSLRILDLSFNQLGNIEQGFFQALENVVSLNLNNNLLTNFNGDYFDGLLELGTLSLASNGIRNIKKGSTKKLKSLSVLDLSNNLFDALRQGAFYGLPKRNSTTIKLVNVPVKFIQSGLFDEF